MGYSPQGLKESDKTERLHFTSLQIYIWIVLLENMYISMMMSSLKIFLEHVCINDFRDSL